MSLTVLSTVYVFIHSILPKTTWSVLLSIFHLPNPLPNPLYALMGAPKARSVDKASRAPLLLASIWIQLLGGTRRDRRESEDRSRVFSPLVVGVPWWSPGVAPFLEYKPQHLSGGLHRRVLCAFQRLPPSLTNSGLWSLHGSPLWPALHCPLQLPLPSLHFWKQFFLLNSL